MSGEDFEPLRAELEDGSYWVSVERTPGQVRPYLFVRGGAYFDDPVWMHRHLLLPPILLEQQLLYFHQVSVADPILPAIQPDGDRLDRVDAMRWLSYAKPMIDAGLVHLLDWRLRRSMFQSSKEVRDGLVFIREQPFISAEEKEEVAALLRSLFETDLIDDFPELFEDDACHVRRALLGTLAQPAGAADMWLPSTKDQDLARPLMSRIYDRIGRPAFGPRAATAVSETLGSIDLPSLRELSAEDFVALRKDEALFEQWRSDLADALGLVPADADIEAIDLRSIHDQLDAASKRLLSTRRRVRSVLAGEMRTISFRLLGAGASAAIFTTRSLAAGAAAIGFGSTAAAAYSTVKVLQDASASSSARNHYMLFETARPAGLADPYWVSGVPMC